MYERVVIEHIHTDKRIMVTCESSACSGCKGESFCNTKGKVFEAANPHHLHLEVGMVVELFLKPSSTIFSTLFTLMFPLALFPLSYYLTKMAGGSEGTSMLVGLAFFIAGFFFVWAFFKLYKDRFVPKIVRIVPEEL